MADATLLLLLKDVRGKTLRLLEGVDEKMARFKPAGLNNDILWHAGHCLIVVEHLGPMAISGGAGAYPKEWFEKFSWTSSPAGITEWPALGEVVGKLKEQQERLAVGIEALGPEQLSGFIGDPAKNKTMRWSILHGLHDEAGHQGEIHLLKKMFAKSV